MGGEAVGQRGTNEKHAYLSVLEKKDQDMKAAFLSWMTSHRREFCNQRTYVLYMRIYTTMSPTLHPPPTTGLL